MQTNVPTDKITLKIYPQRQFCFQTVGGNRSSRREKVLYLVQEAGEEGVRHVVVEKRPLVHQDALDVLAEGRILAQQLHARFSQNGLKQRRQQQQQKKGLIVPIFAIKNLNFKNTTHL